MHKAQVRDGGGAGLLGLAPPHAHVPPATCRSLPLFRTPFPIRPHEMQGSEYPVVALALSASHRPMLTRRLLYTALTRAKVRSFFFFFFCARFETGTFKGLYAACRTRRSRGPRCVRNSPAASVTPLINPSAPINLYILLSAPDVRKLRIVVADNSSPLPLSLE